MSPPSWSLRRVQIVNEAILAGLVEVLIDCVEGGASVSFMHPLSRERAMAFWRRVAQGVAAGERALVIAEDAEGLCGVVQLAFDVPENQPHRADVSKMLVHRRARRQGLGAALMRAAETTARESGRTLLVLDAVTNGDAARLYERLGWMRVGNIPGYALMPRGQLCSTTVYYRTLDAETPVLMSTDSAVSKTEAIGLSDEEFLRQFETCTLPYVHWTHRAHLRVAYCYVARYGLAGAIPKVTAGIRAYNRSQNIVDTLTSGYHETMTVAWLHLVAAMLDAYGPAGAVIPDDAPILDAGAPPSQEFLAAQTQLTEKKLLRLFYSRERFSSPEAKYQFVPPDLAPLPRTK